METDAKYITNQSLDDIVDSYFVKDDVPEWEDEIELKHNGN